MRSKAVFILLVSMFVALLGVTLFRPRTLRTVVVEATPSASALASYAVPLPSASLTASARPSQQPSATLPAPSASSSSAPPPAQKPSHPLRVVGLGWEVLAPGLVANRGRDPGKDSAFTAAELEVHLSPVDGMPAIESALARGGADANGADIAIVPLSSFVASYEHLRALEPRIFFVVGWSRGREALVTGKGSFPKLPATGTVTLAGAPGSSAAYLGLFALDLVGVPASRVELLADDKAAEASFLAIDRTTVTPDKSAKGTVVLTTADVPRLVPLVAIAQSGLAADKQDALRAWVRAWMDGERKVKADTAGSAREIGAMPGAPEPLALVQRLGSITWASLGDNARLCGLSGRGAVTVDTLFQHAWRIWRDARIVGTPPPEVAVSEPGIVASIIRAGEPVDEPTVVPREPEGVRGAAGVALLVVQFPPGALDEDDFVAKLGWIAGLFDRSAIRVALRGPRGVDAAKTRKVIDAVSDRFDVPAARFSPAKKVTGPGAASIEILPVR